MFPSPITPMDSCASLHAASVPAGEVVPITFRVANGPGRGLRVSLVPEPDSRLITGENPSIRRAGEDDSKLDQFSRPFMILRHEAADGRSTFVAVHEPYDVAPYLTSVERVPVQGGAIAVRVGIGERTDVIVIGAGTQVSLPADKEMKPVTFQGELGVLSIRGDAVEHAYASAQEVGRVGNTILHRLDRAAPRSAPLKWILWCWTVPAHLLPKLGM